MLTRWRDSRSTTLDSSGAGTVFILAGRPNLSYRITGVSFQGNSLLIPEGKVYEGTVNGSNYRSGTYDGNNDADNALDITLETGERCSVQWTLGTVGAVMVANFYGYEITPER